MPDTKNEAEDKAEAKPAPRPQKSYSIPELKKVVTDILVEEKIAHIGVRVTRSDIIITQPGDHDSVQAISALLEQPGIFGYDSDNKNEDAPAEVSVRKIEDFNRSVTSTVTTLSRAHAEPIYLDEQEEAELDEEAGDGDGDFTPEDIAKMKTKDADELLVAHGLDPKDFADLKAKREILQETIFVSED